MLGIIAHSFSYAQGNSLKPKDLVANQSQKPTHVDFLSTSTNRDIKVPADLETYDLFDLKPEIISQILDQDLDYLEVNIPTQKRSAMTLQLVKADILSGDGYVTELPSGNTVKVNHGKHYRGIIKGKETSIVALSIFEDQVMGLITDNGENVILAKLEDAPQHIVYESKDLPTNTVFECGTEDPITNYTEADLHDPHHGTRALDDCVSLYFEVDYDIYQDKGSNTTNVTNFITGLFNQVATMYANENINVVMSPLNIWTSTSPYNGSTSSDMLNQFLANTGSFDGDLAMLLSYQASGGIAYVDQLCGNYADYRKSFSSINSTYANVPNYSWSVMVVCHEFGHLFGSSHTHACAWNGNNTAIDGCYTTEGSCSNPGIPSNGGTIMSYCHLQSVGINFNLGFGPQPGNLIRNRVTNANCLAACDDGSGGGGGGGTTCEDTEATLTIVLDNYPGETTWTLKNSAGTTLYSGGPYSGAGSTVTETFCLVDDCYDYQINDSYGDGICCGYGQGSYEIEINGQTVISGGQFGSVEVQNFCVGGTNPPDPTCNDGIQNGQETGIDCGGPDCPACPTCNDGVQNGDETGIDCGGSDCPACPSCNDGIQNGNETGVDCGGPDCPSCPTCNDGIQNGQETGIDCGGPDCDACPTGGGGEIFAHYFESGWDGWADGGSDCYRYSGSRSWEGQYSIRLRDNSGTSSSMTSPSFDASGLSAIEVNFYFYPFSMENGEDFWVRFNGGNGWQTVAAYARGTHFNNNTFYVATVTIPAGSYPMGSNSQIRFQCDASANGDHIYIDAVTVTGIGSGGLIESFMDIQPVSGTAELGENEMIEEMKISPNPSQNLINVEFNSENDQMITYEVYDMMGKLISSNNRSVLTGTNNIKLNIEQYQSGTYYLKLIDEDFDVMVDKFIKIK